MPAAEIMAPGMADETSEVNNMKRIRCLTVLLAVVLTSAALSWGAVFISASFGPPVLPVYVQPPCPAPGYIWAPGYWAWSPDFGNYYWVPGTWVLPPQVGFLWTPGYWGFSAGVYLWRPGFWGPTVGFYGGINYGFGYPGTGYYGGQWRGRDFYYNRSVNNVNITNVHNVYNQTVVNNVTVNRVAYNGGPGGVQARATSAQLAAERGSRVEATPLQRQNEQAARSDRNQFASANQGRPAVVATPKPGALNSSEAVRASLPAGKRPNSAPETANARPVPRPLQRTESQEYHKNAQPQPELTHPPENHAAANPLAPRPSAQHQTEPPRESAAHRPSPKPGNEQRPR